MRAFRWKIIEVFCLWIVGELEGEKFGSKWNNLEQLVEPKLAEGSSRDAARFSLFAIAKR